MACTFPSEAYSPKRDCNLIDVFPLLPYFCKPTRSPLRKRFPISCCITAPNFSHLRQAPALPGVGEGSPPALRPRGWGWRRGDAPEPPVPAVWRATVPSWVTPVAFPSAEQIWVRALSPDSGGRAPCQGVQVGLVLWPPEPPLVGAAGWRSPAGGAPTASQRAPSTPAPPTACGKAPSGEPWLTPLALVTRSHSVRDLIPSDLEARARPTEVHANFFFVEAELIQDQASELPHLEEKGKGARFLQALRHPSPCRQLRWGQETSWSYCGWHLKALR